MFDVHARKWEDRVTIYCNDKGQPVGPEKAKDELSLFLGTIARDHTWAPLTYTDWHQVPNKDKMWEYVNVSSFYDMLIWRFSYNKLRKPQSYLNKDVCTYLLASICHLSCIDVI